MKNISVKAILQITKSEYRRMVTDPRNIVAASMCIVFYQLILNPFIGMSRDMQRPIQILEPFLAVCSSDAVIIMLPLVFLVIINDFPRTDDNFRFYVVRAGKCNWILGHIIYAFFTSVTYMAAVLLVTVVLAFPYSYMQNTWSEVTTKYYIMFPEKIDNSISDLVNARLYNQTMPMEAFFHTFLLYCLYLFLLSMICFLAYMFYRRIAGIVINGIMIVLGEVAVLTNNAAGWCMPAPHAVVWKHYDMVFRQTGHPLSASYIYFILLIAVGIVLVLVRARYKNFDAI